MSNPAVLSKVLYTAVATSTSGREGRSRTDDGQLDLALAMPPGLGGNGDGTNPEQLFAAGYSACFGSAVGFVAKQKQLKIGPVSITAQVSLGPVEGSGAFGLKVKLTGTVPDLPRPEAEALLAAAHQVCPYSNATRGNIEVTLEVA
jgi:Ohr subfamily peroxiredoxin